MASTDNHKEEPRRDQRQIQNQTKSASIRIIPPEVGINIFEYANQLSVQVHKDTANLLSALSSDARLHAEAQEVYNNLFYSVNRENEETFRRLKCAEKMRIKHLEIVAPMMFKAHTITIQSNIEVLTLDYSKDVEHDDSKALFIRSDGTVDFEKSKRRLSFIKGSQEPEVIAKDVVRASKQVKRVVLKMRTLIPNIREQVRVSNFTQALGVELNEKGVLERGVVYHREKGVIEVGVIYWVWESTGGNSLSWPLSTVKSIP
ncbi:hypothetical protein V8E51_001710 [Hyaloscypha variabilis]